MYDTALERIDEMKWQEDAPLRRMTVGGLCAITFLGVVSMTLIDALGRPIPEALVAISCSALGALTMALSMMVKGR